MSEASVDDLLRRLSAVYADLERLRARRADLETVPQAEAAHAEALAEEERTLDALERRRDALRAEQASATGAHDLMDLTQLGRFASSRGARTLRRRPLGERRRGPVPPAPRPSTERRRLKRLINRWAYVLEVDDASLARFNRVIEDRDRPLGEALALLNLDALSAPLSSDEPEDSRRSRLAEWTDALTEYRERLTREIDALETRFAHLTPIWEIWRARESSPDAWLTLLDRARGVKQREIDSLHEEIAELERAAP